MSQHIFLNPGELWTGKCRSGKLTTILGSCVSLVALLPEVGWLGVSHSLLPTRRLPQISALSGRFVDESIWLFVSELSRYGATLRQCELQLYGGGDMFGLATTTKISTVSEQMLCVGAQNLQKLQSLLTELDATVMAQDTGGHCYRHLMVDLQDGRVRLDKNLLQHAVKSRLSTKKAGRYEK